MYINSYQSISTSSLVVVACITRRGPATPCVDQHFFFPLWETCISALLLGRMRWGWVYFVWRDMWSGRMEVCKTTLELKTGICSQKDTIKHRSQVGACVGMMCVCGVVCLRGVVCVWAVWPVIVPWLPTFLKFDDIPHKLMCCTVDSQCFFSFFLTLGTRPPHATLCVGSDSHVGMHSRNACVGKYFYKCKLP